MLIRLSVLTAIALLIQGCASTLTLEPQARSGQHELYREGVETLVSAKKALVVIRPRSSTYSSNERPTFVIYVVNGTDTPFNFSTGDVRVLVDGSPHKVFTYKELRAEIENRRRSQAIAAALRGISQSLNAANAGYKYHSGTYNAYAYDNHGNSAYEYGAYSGYTYDPAASQQARAAANARMFRNMSEIRSEAEHSLKQLSHTMVRKTTILQHKGYGGYVTVAKIDSSSKPVPITVIVTAAGEQHKFLFHLRETGD